MKASKANGDSWFETQVNKFVLTWKFKSMMKYKDCVFPDNKI